jgi:hypothetical protein
MADPMLRAINGMTHSANDRYYMVKWGGPKQGGETKFRRVESSDELRKLIRESESTLGRLWFSGSLGDV